MPNFPFATHIHSILVITLRTFHFFLSFFIHFTFSSAQPPRSLDDVEWMEYSWAAHILYVSEANELNNQWIKKNVYALRYKNFQLSTVDFYLKWKSFKSQD